MPKHQVKQVGDLLDDRLALAHGEPLRIVDLVRDAGFLVCAVLARGPAITGTSTRW